MTDVQARPPRWALQAGLPPAVDGELLRPYCERIGVDYDTLVEGIRDERALDCANIRLSHVLRQRCPRSFDRFVKDLARKWL